MARTAPLLYEVAARPWLARLSARAGRRVTLGDVPDEEIERIAGSGFDILWPMGVWRTGRDAERIANQQGWLLDRWRAAFPGGDPPELVASPYAIREYLVADDLGGEAGLARLRARLDRAGVRLVLDFVAHDTATDAPWLRDRPDSYVTGDESQRAADPHGYLDEPIPGSARWIAHGRDPNFPPWTDTVALELRNPAVRRALTEVLLRIAERCDGIRADMAMLSLEDVFRRTWEGRSVPPRSSGEVGGPDQATEFWASAIARVRAARPDFLFIGEAYWDLGWRLQQLGFDATYDKTFRDRLVAGDGRGLAAHLHADPEFQRRSVRFLENHDEARAAAELPPERHRAGAVLAATVPGTFLIHDGQIEGARFRSPVQFARRPDEPVDEAIRAFYGRLLGALTGSRLRDGTPVRLEPEAAWPGNPTHEPFVAHLWAGPDDRRHLGVVNLGETAGQCRLRIVEPALAGRIVELEDLLGGARYERSGDELAGAGLYLDMPAWGHHLFRIA